MYQRIGIAFLLLAAMAFALSGCLFGPTVVTESDRGALIRLDVGDRLLVRLGGTPSTGFSWIRLRPEHMATEPLEPVVEGVCELADQCGALGRPGTYEFQYRAITPGTVTLTYAYQRPWEGEPAEVFTIIVWVR